MDERSPAAPADPPPPASAPRHDALIRWLGLATATVFAIAGILYILAGAILTPPVATIGAVGLVLLLIQTALVVGELSRRK